MDSLSASGISPQYKDAGTSSARLRSGGIVILEVLVVLSHDSKEVWVVGQLIRGLALVEGSLGRKQVIA